MRVFRPLGHSVRYVGWLGWQLLVAAWAVIRDANRPKTRIDPVIVAYPLRVTTPRLIAMLSTSITVTPGTLSIGVVPVGQALPADVSLVVGPHEPVPSPECVESPLGRLLLVHAVFGEDPVGVLRDIADMEEHLAPAVAERTQPVTDASYYVTSLRHEELEQVEAEDAVD